MVERVRLSWRYYVYVYYDTRPGKDRIPIYVGKGSKRVTSKKFERAYNHWRLRSSNKFLQSVLDKIRDLGLIPEIEIAAVFLTEEEALAYEIGLIRLYGRRNLGTGTLLNLTDGGEGVKGRVMPPASPELVASIREFWANPKRRKQQSKALKRYWASMSSEERASWCANIGIGLRKLWKEDPKLKARLVHRNKENWAKPNYKEKVGAAISTGLLSYFKSEAGQDLKTRLSVLMQKGTPASKKLTAARWTPELRAKQSAYSKEVSVKFLEIARNDPKVKRKQRKAARAWWAIKENKEKRRAAILASSERRGKQHSIHLRKKYKDPKEKAVFLAQMQAGKTPKTEKRRAETMRTTLKARWAADPEFRVRMLAAFAKGHEEKRKRVEQSLTKPPNEPEFI